MSQCKYKIDTVSTYKVYSHHVEYVHDVSLVVNWNKVQHSVPGRSMHWVKFLLPRAPHHWLTLMQALQRAAATTGSALHSEDGTLLFCCRPNTNLIKRPLQQETPFSTLTNTLLLPEVAGYLHFLQGTQRTVLHSSARPPTVLPSSLVFFAHHVGGKR